jgi:ribosomal protein L7/L12
VTFPAFIAIIGVALILLWRWTSSVNEHAEEVMKAVAQDESGVRALIALDETVAAIKLARKITGLDLKASKELIESLRGGREVPFPRLTEVAPERLLAAARDRQIRQLIAQGDTIAAIKRWRELTGHSLVEAKAAVEQLEELPLVDRDIEPDTDGNS